MVPVTTERRQPVGEIEPLEAMRRGILHEIEMLTAIRDKAAHRIRLARRRLRRLEKWGLSPKRRR